MGDSNHEKTRADMTLVSFLVYESPVIRFPSLFVFKSGLEKPIPTPEFMKIDR